ncbi:hypothetical protein BKA93DRAFT_453055 [Sparassis latifolia]
MGGTGCSSTHGVYAECLRSVANFLTSTADSSDLALLSSSICWIAIQVDFIAQIVASSESTTPCRAVAIPLPQDVINDFNDDIYLLLERQGKYHLRRTVPFQILQDTNKSERSEPVLLTQGGLLRPWAVLDIGQRPTGAGSGLAEIALARSSNRDGISHPLCYCMVEPHAPLGMLCLPWVDARPLLVRGEMLSANLHRLSRTLGFDPLGENALSLCRYLELIFPHLDCTLFMPMTPHNNGSLVPDSVMAKA